MKRVVLALTLGLAVAVIPAVAQDAGSTGSTSSSSAATESSETSSGLAPRESTPTGAAALHGSTTTHDELSGTPAPDTATTTTTTGTNTLRQDDTGTVTTRGSAEVQETRTNPDAASLAPGGGLTLTGTVVSWNDQEIVVRTTTGIEHVVIQPNTRRPATFTEGQVVSIDYNRTSQNGVMIAEQIRPGDAPVVRQGSVDAETRLDAAADELGANISQLDDELEEEIEEELGANLDNDSTIGDSVTADMDDDTPDTFRTTTSTLDTSLPATAGESPLVALLGLAALGAAAGLRRLF